MSVSLSEARCGKIDESGWCDHTITRFSWDTYLLRARSTCLYARPD